jgi:purine-binding chemotaxis protein CheW
VAETSVGLVVDEVEEVLNIPETQVDPPPKVRRGKASGFIQGMGKMDEEVKILLDVDKLLHRDEIEQIAS